MSKTLINFLYWIYTYPRISFCIFIVTFYLFQKIPDLIIKLGYKMSRYCVCLLIELLNKTVKLMYKFIIVLKKQIKG
jgi:hypothetical protein